MHVTVELEDSPPKWPPGDLESDCLAAFLISVDVFKKTDITRRSLPELLDDPAQWPLHFGAGGSLRRPDDPEVHEAIEALAQWADDYATRERKASPLAPFQQFTFENPSTDEDLDLKLKESAWQDRTDVVLGSWVLRAAIQQEPTLKSLGAMFPFLESNFHALRQIVLSARGPGRRLRLLLATD